MASDRFGTLISRVKEHSVLLADQSTRLSNQIESFESVLRSLDGKVPVSAKDKDGAQLAFLRTPNGVWRLFFTETDTEKFIALGNASVEIKIKSVLLFEPLLEQLAKTQAHRLAELEHACDAMSGFSKFLTLEPKEGA